MATLHFHTAANAQNKAAVQKCIDEGYDAMRKDKDGNTVLHWACFKGNPEIVKMVLSAKGVDVNHPNTTGNTPLHYAAIANKVEATKILLEANADPNAVNENGQSPLHGAVGRASPTMVDVLCNHMAPDRSNVHVDEKKLKKGGKENKGKRPKGCADPNLMDKEGYTPMHLCTYRAGGNKVWKMLIKCGADESIKGGEWGCEPMHPWGYAVQKVAKMIPMIVLPLVLFYHFLCKPSIDRMKEEGTWESYKQDEFLLPLKMTWEFLLEFVGLDGKSLTSGGDVKEL